MFIRAFSLYLKVINDLGTKNCHLKMINTIKQGIMKKFYATLIGLFVVLTGFSQSCLPEGITFETQAQIDSFQANYPNCTEIEGDVKIGKVNGSDITNLNGLSVLTSFGKNFIILNNPFLINLSGLENVTNIEGDLRIEENNTIVTLNGLNNLTHIGGNVYIIFNDNLINLSGLNNLNSIEGYLDIGVNESMISLTGLESLESVGGYLCVEQSPLIINLYGLNSLKHIGSHLWIEFNNSITSLAGMPLIDSIGGGLSIGSDSSLTNLAGLENLVSIGGYLMFWDNTSLTNLTGLNNLTSIGGNLSIGTASYGGNPALTSLSGLDNIEAGSVVNLKIIQNNLLSICAIQSICDYLVSPNGTIEIHDNTTGCNSQEEVEDACGVGLNESKAFDDQFNIYPNPSSTTITISTPTTPNKNTFLTIYNLNGQQLIKRQITEQQTVIDVSELVKGVYFVRAINDRTVMVGKFVKQ
jgi:hypothetical protein